LLVKYASDLSDDVVLDLYREKKREGGMAARVGNKQSAQVSPGNKQTTPTLAYILKVDFSAFIRGGAM